MELKFKKRFWALVHEDMTSGSAFAGGGGTGGSFSNADSYAPGDARVPFALGTVDPRKGKKKKRKNKKKKNRKTKEHDVPAQGYPPMQTRAGHSGMSGPSNKDPFGFM